MKDLLLWNIPISNILLYHLFPTFIVTLPNYMVVKILIQFLTTDLFVILYNMGQVYAWQFYYHRVSYKENRIKNIPRLFHYVGFSFCILTTIVELINIIRKLVMILFVMSLKIRKWFNDILIQQTPVVKQLHVLTEKVLYAIQLK